MANFKLEPQYILQSINLTLDADQIQQLAKARALLEDMITTYVTHNPLDTRTSLINPVRDLCVQVDEAVNKAAAVVKLTGGAAGKVLRAKQNAAAQN